MSIRIKYEEDYVIVLPDEEIEVYNISEIKEVLFDIIEKGNRRLIMDMSRVEYIDSSGLGVLVSVLKKVKHAEGKLVLISPKSSVKQILSLTNLDKVFNIQDNLENAVEAVRR
jgi:anti-sigma B factor antagonist